MTVRDWLYGTVGITCMLYTDVFVTMTFNGTFYTSSPITDVECVNQYADVFKNSFDVAIRYAERAIEYDKLCASITPVADSFTLEPGSIHLVAISNKV